MVRMKSCERQRAGSRRTREVQVQVQVAGAATLRWQNAKRRRATATTRLRFAPLSGIGPNSLRFSDGKGLHLKFFRRKLAGLAQRTIDLLAGRYHHCTLL